MDLPTTRANAASEAAKREDFSAKVRPSDPLITKGHAVGVKVGNDAAPEYHAETFPAGTGSKEHTHQPNAEGGVSGQALNEFPTAHMDPLDMPGATLQSVYTGLGKPL